MRTFVFLKRKIDVGAVDDEREKLPIHAARGGVVFFVFLLLKMRLISKMTNPIFKMTNSFFL